MDTRYDISSYDITDAILGPVRPAGTRHLGDAHWHLHQAQEALYATFRDNGKGSKLHDLAAYAMDQVHCLIHDLDDATPGGCPGFDPDARTAHTWQTWEVIAAGVSAAMIAGVAVWAWMILF